MSIEEITEELQRLSLALLETTPLREWEAMISRYNALKIRYCMIIGTGIHIASFNNE